MFAVNVLLCVIELNVHVRIDTDQGAFVFRLAPLETNNDVFANQGL